MSAFTDLLTQSPSERTGFAHTAAEIYQQPDVWLRVVELILSDADRITAFLDASGVTGKPESSVVLTGAGSSDFIGRSIAATLRAHLSREVASVATTDIVTHPTAHFCRGGHYTIIHFARSGDSPESLAAYRLLRRAIPESAHIVITCNSEGRLLRETAADQNTLAILLPPETNDRSLAMTSSFTSMALAAVSLCYLSNPSDLRTSVERTAEAARRIIEEHADLLERFSSNRFHKACYLGSNSLAGAMNEAALKMLELTAGRVTALCNSFLGIRHGPRVFVDGDCAVVACLSSDAAVRRYELDLLRELREKEQGAGILAICAGPDDSVREITDDVVTIGAEFDTGDQFRVFTDIVACQILAFFTSRKFGLTPDNPSPDGIIHRVVQGVTIYDSDK
ncbi:SIS domain-containing protein [Salinispira pacifica]